MKAMVLKKVAPIEEKPLELEDWPTPAPGPKEILVKISACGVCHTELDEIEGRLQPTMSSYLAISFHVQVGALSLLSFKAKTIIRRQLL